MIENLSTMQRYCSREPSESREIMSRPGKVIVSEQAWTVATNGRKLVATPEDMGAETFSVQKKVDDIVKILNTFFGKIPLAQMPRDKLSEMCGPAEWPQEVICRECHGDGKTTCSECEQQRSCPDYEGTGKATVFPEHNPAFLGDFKADLSIVAQCLEWLEGDAIAIHADEKLMRFSDGRRVAFIALMLRDAIEDKDLRRLSLQEEVPA